CAPPNSLAASLYPVYHGPRGLREIAQTIHDRAAHLADDLVAAGIRVVHDWFFDTVLADVPSRAAAVVAAARADGVHLRLIDDDHVGGAGGGEATPAHLNAVRKAFGASTSQEPRFADNLAGRERTTDYLSH